MTQQRHTSLSLRTQLSGLSSSVQSCDPSDYFATSRLVQQLAGLRTQMEKDQVQDLIATCSLAVRIAEILNRDGQVGPKQALALIDTALAQLCDSLGVERGPVSKPESEAAEPALPNPDSKKGGRELKTISSRKLGEIMIQLSMLTPAQVEQALSHQRMTGCRLGEALIQMKFLTRDTVESALRIQGVRRGVSDDPWRSR